MDGTVVFLFLIGLGLYFLPTFIGANKKRGDAIAALNLLLGWTLIGWVGALVWALAEEEEGGRREARGERKNFPVSGPRSSVNPLSFCPQCGRDTQRSDIFCRSCGKRLQQPIELTEKEKQRTG